MRDASDMLNLHRYEKIEIPLGLLALYKDKKMARPVTGHSMCLYRVKKP